MPYPLPIIRPVRLLAGVAVVCVLLGGQALAEDDSPLGRRKPTPILSPTAEPKVDEGFRDLILQIQGTVLEDRIKALLQLAKYSNTKEVLSTVTDIYDESVDWEMRQAAIQVMGKIRHENHIAVVSKALTEDKDHRVRLAAAEVMEVWKSRDWHNALIIGISYEKDTDVTRAVVRALDANGIDIMSIADYSMRHRGKDLKLITADILTRLEDPRAVKILADFVKDPDPLIRRKVVYSLGAIGREECVGHLIPALVDQDREVRLTALASIGQIGTEQSVTALEQVMLTHFDLEMRRRASTDLGTLKSKRSIPTLMKGAEAEDEDLRQRCITSIGKIGDPSAIPFLKKVIDNSVRVQDRVNAISSLGLIGGADAIRIARTSLNSKEPAIREMSAFILGQLRDKGSVDSLIKLLNDESLFVTIASINALGLIGDARAYDPIEAKLEGRTPKELDEAVYKALGRLKGKKN